MQDRTRSGPTARAVTALLATVTVATTSAALGAEFGATIEGGVGHSDNIARTPDQEIDESLGTVGLDLLYHEETRRLNADVLADVSYIDYLDDTFDSEVLGNASANVVLGIAPDRFLWTFDDRFGQIRSNVFAAATPANRENVNVMSTGPDLLFRLGTHNSARLTGRYSRTDFEDTDFDQDSVSGSVSLSHELSGGSSVSLVGETASYEYDATSRNSDYDRHSAYLSYDVTGSRTTLGVDLGYTVVDFGSEDNNGLLARLDISRRLSSASTLTFAVGTNFSDAGDAFREAQRQSSDRNDTQSTIATADAFRRRYANLGWTFARNRTEVNLSAGYTEERYERQTSLDRDVLIASASLRRELGRALDLTLSARLEQEEFESGFDDDDWRAGAEFSWNVGRRAVIGLRLFHFERTSSDPATEYDENQAWLTVGYRMGQGQQQ